MSLMWKLLIATLAAASLSFAATNAEIEEFLQAGYEQNPHIKVEKIKVLKRTKVNNGWERVDYALKAKVGENSRELSNSIYTTKNFIAQQIIERRGDKHETVSDIELFDFADEMVAKNSNIELQGSKVVNRFKMSQIDGLEAVQLEFKLLIKQDNQQRVVETTEVWFAQKGVIIPEIIDLVTGDSVKSLVKGEVRAEHYRKDRLIAGEPNAQYKMVVFSDPFCSACHFYMPDLIKLAEKHPKKVAVYYYYKQIIPPSSVVEKATILAMKEGKKGVIKELYDSPLKIKSRDEMEALNAFNTRFKTKYTMDQINKSEIVEHINSDAKAASQLLILSTPTLFINGKYDAGFREFKKIQSELK